MDAKIHGGEFFNPLVKEGEVTFPSTNFHLLRERVEREITNVMKFGRVPKELSWEGEFPRIKTKEEVLEDYKNDPAPFPSFCEYGVRKTGEADWVYNPSKVDEFLFFVGIDVVENYCSNHPIEGVNIYPEHAIDIIQTSSKYCMLHVIKNI